MFVSKVNMKMIMMKKMMVMRMVVMLKAFNCTMIDHRALAEYNVYVFSGCDGENDGGMAEVLRLFLAHVQRDRLGEFDFGSM